MKKLMVLSLVIVFLFQSIALSAFSAESDIESVSNIPKTPAEVLTNINQDMQELYMEPNYYPNKTVKGELREDLLQKKIIANKNNFEIVYGKDHDKLEYIDMYRYSGYSREGDHVSTEGAPWDAGWSGKQIQEFNMVEIPWEDPKVLKKYDFIKSDFDAYEDNTNKYLADSAGTFEKAIIKGLNEDYAGKKYKEFIYNHQREDLVDEEVYTLNATPSKGGKWIDYVHVLQPPTYLSWGSGRIYIQGSSGNITYLGVRIAPFSLQTNDLSPNFENLPSGVVEGQEVTVGVKLRSSITKDITTDYSWKITSGGNNLSVNYLGQESLESTKLVKTVESGDTAIPGNSVNRIFYATFTMPQGDVDIKFNLNSKKSPKEASYTNNEINATIKRVTAMPNTTGEYELDYNVLSRKIVFPLANGADITANLILPSQSKWNGNATGALTVMNNTEGVFRYFSVANNRPVNDDGISFIRKPLITASLQRTDFGDDPVNGKWYNNPTPYVPKEKSGNVSFQGEVSRNYITEKENCSSETDLQGKVTRTCNTYSENGNTTAPFTPGQDVKDIKVKIYNGRESIEPKEYDNKIENNETDSLIKKLLWTSEPYIYKVIRWMGHMNEKAIIEDKDWVAVNGQYNRTFTQQASGDISWKVEKSMDQAYKKAREAARKMQNNKSSYDTAVFATDKQLQQEKYPIKSGYYFNPAGVYTFTLETVTFKKELPKDKTKDHEDLLTAITNSFRYETDLMYINNKKNPVNLLNEALVKVGNAYKRKPAALSVENNKGVNGDVLLTLDVSDYTLKDEEIKYSQDRVEDKDTHEFWKNILEGYSQSSTLGSFNNFKYREYVGLNQYMYKITEKTTVSIKINPENLPVYTNAGMADGKYYVRAWLADVELSKSTNAYKSLGKVVGIKPLDQIEITVKGSMFDDLNN